jgi:hypothetical protein
MWRMSLSPKLNALRMASIAFMDELSLFVGRPLLHSVVVWRRPKSTAWVPADEEFSLFAYGASKRFEIRF